jgi:glutamine amidotransferase
MCELMGLCFAKPVSADFSIREFAHRDAENADGWGLAWYPDRSVAVVKEPVSWRTSKYTGFLETYHALHSTIYLAHVRHKTVGGVASHANTHPFVRELAGREFCFAHNGTLLDFSQQLQLGRFRPLGNTDSEYVFCHLLDELAAREPLLDEEADWRWLHAKLSRLNRFGKLNCLLSDGLRLFCYHDAAGYKGLMLRKLRIHSQQTRRLEDADVEIAVAGESHNVGITVATHALSDTGWHRFLAGELIVLENGQMRFSSQRSREAVASLA